MSLQMQRNRDPIVFAGVVLTLAIAITVGVESLGWIGKTFPGFLVLENRVVASAGLAHWPAAQSGRIYQHELIAIDGDPVGTADEVARRLQALPANTPVEFTLQRGGEEIIWADAPRVFTRTDYLLLHGTLFFCGLGLAGIALAIRFLRGSDPVANGAFVSLWIVGLWALTAVDLYGPYRFFRLHALLECLLFAAVFHNSLVFPTPARLLTGRAWLVPSVYGLAAALGLATEIGLFDPATYVVVHRIAVNAFALSLVAFIARQIHAFVRPSSFEVRQRVKVVALGTVAALTPQVVIMFYSAFSGGRVPENLMSFSGMFFPVSMSYAVLKQDLFGVDVILRRSLNYALLTGMVLFGYAGLAVGFDTLSQSVGEPGGLSLVVGAAFVVALLPLRDRVQNGVDRLFFRSAYDFRRVVETMSGTIASVTRLDVIADELERALRESLRPEFIHLDVSSVPDGELQRILDTDSWGDADTPDIDVEHLRDRPLDLPNDGLAVPFRVDGRLIGLLTLGRRMSGRYYGGDDRRLLQTLANQAAVALANAIVLERLAELNRSLEEKVEERTAELECSVSELRAAQTQLVQKEKLASLGQLVAGVAHEINNPVNFIQGNVCFLEEHVEALVSAFERIERVALAGKDDLANEIDAIRKDCELDHVFEDLPRAFASCKDGLTRTTTIIRDLRSFARPDNAAHVTVDIHDVIESTLSLLTSRLNGIELVRDYGELSPVECIRGQMSQVFMNLVTNAADAVSDGGRITIRTRSLDVDRVLIEVEDDGCGIPESEVDRVFDPFFSTKEVGRGTGLGLSITYGIVTRHGGRIDVHCVSGEGTCFAVELPVAATDGRQERERAE